MSNLEERSPGEAAAYREGWRAGLVLGAVAVAVAAFINLLSMEKSILAIVLALIAIRGAGPGRTRFRGRLALAIAAVHLAVAATVFILLHDKLERLFSLLQSLG
ncbi:hypothetical protein [Mesorhizobium sp. INR15]|uniref:hypothetical protein n=1 Tax=Mesorhizobium sp. INR15 TaxID=2654248 RepID=UPI00189691AE|nr:hypothetical protein [Mesorhizobium sp. INR15]QPC91901.1 hypothetical protein GA829_15635 [Mesorhizobium sp. INR15]